MAEDKSVTSTMTEEVIAKLESLGVSGEIAERLNGAEFGVETIEDLYALGYQDFIDAGMSRVVAKKLVADINSATSTAGKDNDSPRVPSGLSEVPAGIAGISTALRTDGILALPPLSVAYIIQASVAPDGIFDAIPTLYSEIEKRYKKLKKPAPAGFIKRYRSEMTKRRYPEILALIEDSPGGDYITDAKRNALIKDARDVLLPRLYNFSEQLLKWRAEYRADLQDNAIFGMTAMAAGGAGAMDLAFDEPSTKLLVAALGNLVDTVNEVLAWDGDIVALAVGAETKRITDTIGDETLWSLAGVSDMDELKSLLKLKANAMTESTEENLVRFAYNCMLLSQKSGSIPARTVKDLIQCSNDISWPDVVGNIATPRTNTDIPHVGGRL